MAQPAQTQPQINIELPADLDAIYSNFAIISHSPSEIVIDFARLLPGAPKSKVLTRIKEPENSDTQVFQFSLGQTF